MTAYTTPTAVSSGVASSAQFNTQIVNSIKNHQERLVVVESAIVGVVGFQLAGSVSVANNSLGLPSITEITDTNGFWPGGSNATATIPSGKGGIYSMSIRAQITSGTPKRFFAELIINGNPPNARDSAGLINDSGSPANCDLAVSAGVTEYLPPGSTIKPNVYQVNAGATTYTVAIHIEVWRLIPV